MADETVGVAGMSESFITHMQRKVRRSRDAFPDDWRTRYTFYDGEVANLLEAVLAHPTPQQPTQAAEPRAIIRHFAAAMERKLAANDATKGGWRNTGTFGLLGHARGEFYEFIDALNEFVNLEDGALEGKWSADVLADARQAMLLEAADCANMLMFVCDVCGALPPTDERGR